MTIPSACRAAVTAAALTWASVTAAHAEPFVFTLNGALYGASISGTPIADGTAFTTVASFDTSSPNLAPFPGTAFYVPSDVAFSVAGTTYQVASFSTAVPFGVAVAIFDLNAPFPPVPEYAAGLIANPLVDGAGIVADFTSAAPNFTVDSLVTTQFPGSAYVGTASFAGKCILANQSDCKVPGFPEVDDVEPIPLTANGQAYSLVFGDNVGLNYALALNDPDTDPGAITVTSPFTASLTDVPEPRSVLLLALGLTAVTCIRSSRRR